MTSAEIVRLIAEMIVEDARQPALSKDEFPELLYECLAFYTMTRLPNSIQQLGPLGGNQLAQTYAPSLPADDSVNDPAALDVNISWWQRESVRGLVAWEVLAP